MVPKKKKQKTTSKLKKELWTIFSRFVRLRDAIRTTGDCDWCICVTCGKRYETVKMQAGHFVAKSVSNYLRFDEKNVHAQCYACNCYRDGEQDLHGQAILTLYGVKTLARLRKDRWKIKRDSRPEIKLMTLKYKKKLNDLINEYGSPWK